MRTNHTKAKLASGGTVFGTFVRYPDAALVDFLCYQGWDYLVDDLCFYQQAHELVTGKPPRPDPVQRLCRAVGSPRFRLQRAPLVRVLALPAVQGAAVARALSGPRHQDRPLVH